MSFDLIRRKVSGNGWNLKNSKNWKLFFRVTFKIIKLLICKTQKLRRYQSSDGFIKELKRAFQNIKHIGKVWWLMKILVRGSKCSKPQQFFWVDNPLILLWEQIFGFKTYFQFFQVTINCKIKVIIGDYLWENKYYIFKTNVCIY